MKKIVLSTAMALCLLCGVNAHAQEQSLRPYVGADVGVNVMPSDGGLTYDVNVGIKQKFWGLEAFYLGNNAENEKAIKYNGNTGNGLENAEFSTEMYAVGLDALGYVALGEKFNIIGSVGYGMYFYEEEIDFPDQVFGSGKVDTPDINHTQTAHGIRIGAGAMYEFFPKLSARAMVRYTLVEMGSYEKYSNPLAVTLGLRYTF